MNHCNSRLVIEYWICPRLPVPPVALASQLAVDPRVADVADEADRVRLHRRVEGERVAGRERDIERAVARQADPAAVAGLFFLTLLSRSAWVLNACVTMLWQRPAVRFMLAFSAMPSQRPVWLW
jgi:hypothetical protein